MSLGVKQGGDIDKILSTLQMFRKDGHKLIVWVGPNQVKDGPFILVPTIVEVEAGPQVSAFSILVSYFLQCTVTAQATPLTAASATTTIIGLLIII